MSDIYSLAQSLSQKYDPENQSLVLHNKRNNFLGSSIIPSDMFAYSGYGASVTTNRGTLLDIGSMTVNCILGQNDPWVNANLMAYLASGRPSFLTTRIGGSAYYALAQRLLQLTSRTDGFINHRQSNGSDVTELAILAAYNNRQPEQSKLISFKGSYHGQGLTAFHASNLQVKHRFLMDASPVVFLDQPSNSSSLLDDASLNEHDAKILKDIADLAPTTFGIIIEPIQVNSSVNIPSRAFMQSLSSIAKAKGVALIYDEVQTGCGWLGTMTAAEQYGVKPDLFAISKALTAGYGPLSALIGDKQYDNLTDGSASKTNGADIRSLIAADAVMDRLFGVDPDLIDDSIPEQLHNELEHGLLAGFDKKQAYLAAHLKNIAEQLPGLVKAIKGQGLIRGIQLVPSQDVGKKTSAIQSELLSSGVLVRHSGDTLIVKPPIVISNEQLDEAFLIIRDVLRRCI